MWKKYVATLALAAGMFLSAAAAHAETRVVGAGATFPKPLYLKWISTYNEKSPDVKLDYAGGGSGAGIKAITDRTVQFAGSDAPLSEAQLSGAPAPLIHIPTVAGPVVLIFNLPGTATLTLDGPTISGIYTGQIKTWDDAKIKALNPNVTLPSKAISVAHRSDPSGTTNIFSHYLAAVSPIWHDKVGAGIDIKWPKGDGGKGNDGVADLVKNVEGGVGYVELAYAKTKGLPFASVVNKQGNTVEASIAGVVAAAGALKDIPENLVVDINNSSGAEAYPIAGFTYVLVYQDLKNGNMDHDQAQTLANFLLWAVTDGQAAAGDLNYAKLPTEMQEKVVAKVKSLTFDGKALLK